MVLLGLLLMEINIFKIKGFVQKREKLTNLLFKLTAIILEERTGLYISQVFNQSIESLFLSR